MACVAASRISVRKALEHVEPKVTRLDVGPFLDHRDAEAELDETVGSTAPAAPVPTTT